MQNTNKFKKPLLLFVSGAPGSGKTVLSEKLSRRMGLFHLERDKLKYGIEFMLSSGPSERAKTIIPIYFQTLRELVSLNISCIADGAHFAGRTEHDLKAFEDSAYIVNIHCAAENVIDRARKRDVIRDKTTPDWTPEFTPDYETMLPLTSEPTSHAYPLLEVNCDEDYDPKLDDIISWVYEQLR